MKNLNEPHRNPNEPLRKDEAVKPDAEVIPFQKPTTLIAKRQVEELRADWTRIQTNFVDEPRKAVADADKLVSNAIKQLEETFTSQRANLERQWPDRQTRLTGRSDM
jgi:hypothetical protein